MNIFVYHENVSGRGAFTKTGDAWEIDKDYGIFAVADSPLRSLVRDTKQYPFDDHGYKAASTFCESFVKYTKDNLKSKSITKENLKEILLKCNGDIRELNNQLGKKYDDPLNYDLAETVGIGAIIDEDNIYYGGVEDCYLNILRGKDLKEVSTWGYQIMKAKEQLDRISDEGKLQNYIPEQLKGKLQKESEWEPCWCTYLRNNPDVINDKGEAAGWGCFTGEDEIEGFLQTHSTKLQKDDHILLFSDGMIPVLQDSNFVKWFIENVTHSFYFQLEMRDKIMELLEGSDDKFKEKTLIYLQY